MGPRTGLDGCGKPLLRPARIQYHDCPALRISGRNVGKFAAHTVKKSRRQQDRQGTYNVTERRGKAVLLIGLCVHACACVRACGYPGAWACACAYVHVALLFQLATRMCHIVTSFLPPQSLPNVSTLSHNRYDFMKNVIKHKMCSFPLKLLSKTFLILRII